MPRLRLGLPLFVHVTIGSRDVALLDEPRVTFSRAYIPGMEAAWVSFGYGQRRGAATRARTVVLQR